MSALVRVPVPGRGAPRLVRVAAVLLALGRATVPAGAQDVAGQPEAELAVGMGRSIVLTDTVNIARVAISDEEVAEAVVVSAREVLINGRQPGVTSLILWTQGGLRRHFRLEVTPDAELVARQLLALFPDERIQVTASGPTLLLTGQVSDSTVQARALALAEATGASVVVNLGQAGPRRQVLLRVRIAEVSRSAVEQLGVELRALRLRDPGSAEEVRVETVSDGLVSLLLGGNPGQLEAVITALRARGLFRSLAEPNLITLDGEQATFLAGGEFPFPVLQGGGGTSDAITLTWKEFGVRLTFLPVVTDSGTIRLRVAPEVSSLDFANGLRLSGFQIPVVLTRRAETEVELREGQYLSIAGLLGQSLRQNETRIPLLGDIPLLGRLFRSRDDRREDSELVVIVTPELVVPSALPPPLPAGLEPAAR